MFPGGRNPCESVKPRNRKEGKYLGSEGIQEEGETEEQESLQLVLWSLAPTSVSFPIPRLTLIA